MSWYKKLSRYENACQEGNVAGTFIATILFFPYSPWQSGNSRATGAEKVRVAQQPGIVELGSCSTVPFSPCAALSRSSVADQPGKRTVMQREQQPCLGPASSL